MTCDWHFNIISVKSYLYHLFKVYVQLQVILCSVYITVYIDLTCNNNSIVDIVGIVAKNSRPFVHLVNILAFGTNRLYRNLVKSQ